MSQLFGGISTLILGLFYDNPADAPLWAIGGIIAFMLILSIMAFVGYLHFKGKNKKI